MDIRKASLSDPVHIAALINSYASRGLMLPRALNDVYENLRDFFVCDGDNGRLLGCVALHVCWEGLGEIRSLAVCNEMKGCGIGKRLVHACLDEARQMGMVKVFTLTFEPDFFRKLGFEDFPKEDLPHKVWSDCLRCPHFPNCDETALMLTLPPGAAEGNTR